MKTNFVLMALFEIFAQSDLQQLIYNFLLPFVFTFLILYSVIGLLKIFTKRIAAIITLIITVFFASTDAFVTFTTLMSQLTGGFAVATFFAILLFGIVQYSAGKGKKWQEEFGTGEEKLKSFNKRIAKLRERLEEADTEEEKDEIREEIDEWEKKREREIRRHSS